MAKNVKINGVTYNNVPSVKIPLADTSGDASFFDTSDGTATADKLLTGATAYAAEGKIVGTLTAASVTQDSGTRILTIK